MRPQVLSGGTGRSPRAVPPPQGSNDSLPASPAPGRGPTVPGGPRGRGGGGPCADSAPAGSSRHGEDGGVCVQGVGRALARDSLRRASRLAEGQRLPPARTPAAHAVLPRLLQEHLPDTHRDRQHLDALAGFCLVPVPGDPDHAAAQHVLHGPSPGEGGVRDVLPGSGAVPQLLLAFPHRLLSLGEGLADFFKVGLFRNCTADHGELRPVALLFVLLLPAAKTHLPLHRLCPGHLRHHRCPVGPVRHPQAQADASRRFPGAGAERRGAHHALHHRRGLRQSHHGRADGLVLPHGCDVHHGRGALRCPHPRALLPGQVRHLVSVTSDLPCAGGGRSLCPLLRGVEPAGVPLRTGRGVHRRLSPLRAPGFSTSFLSAF
ncbi:adiponectin receptor 1 [Columba livia]|uniref:Adiponectin receptor 1 n=1 Tax=Columba livia TaxID=8932 RepID=A0A2I0LZT9_COLLI|nr:adiponectin receptor 1 [Columba livia]